jgi:hypothetical protein
MALILLALEQKLFYGIFLKINKANLPKNNICQIFHQVWVWDHICQEKHLSWSKGAKSTYGTDATFCIVHTIKVPTWEKMHLFALGFSWALIPDPVLIVHNICSLVRDVLTWYGMYALLRMLEISRYGTAQPHTCTAETLDNLILFTNLWESRSCWKQNICK